MQYITKEDHEYRKENGRGGTFHKINDGSMIPVPEGYVSEYYDLVDGKLVENLSDRTSYLDAKEADIEAKFGPLRQLKSDLLAMKEEDLTDLATIASYLIKMRDALAALEKETFDI